MNFIIISKECYNNKLKNKKIMWLARDKEGNLYLYNLKPTVISESFVCGTDSNGTWSSYIELDKNLHPEVTWENSPKEIIMTVVE